MNKLRRGIVLGLLSLFLLTTGTGCQALYFIFGQGNTSAQYKLPRKQRVLVLVDSAVRSPMTLHGISDLEQAISNQLYQNDVAKNLVPSFRLMELEKNPRSFHKMGIADIATAMNAQVVVYVFVEHFSIQLLSDHQISRGYASAVVKVVSADGKRLFPRNATPGVSVEAQIPEGLVSSQNVATVEREIIAELSKKVGQLFYSHSVGYLGSQK